MIRPCTCYRAAVGEYDPSQCRMCWHALNSPKYQRLWGLVEVASYSCCGPAVKPTGAMIADELYKAFEAKPVVTINSGPMVWALGVTTVPERDHLLSRTLGSLAVGGFGRPQVFVERGLKAFGTWWHGLVELWVCNPHADRYMMLQDDVVFVKNCRQYLDRVPHPERGYWNLFTTRDNEEIAKNAKAAGWYEASLARTSGDPKPGGQQTGRGALALVFPRQALIELLTSRHLVERPMDGVAGTKSIDGCVVTAMNKADYREYVHAPSLVQHTGDVSTISTLVEEQLREKGIKRVRIAKSFPGESFDAMTWLK